MAKVSVVSPEKTQAVTNPEGCEGTGRTRAYLEGAKFPLQLHLHELEPGESLTIGPMPAACVVYVWHGGVEAGGHDLVSGSSIIVEHGESLAITGVAAGTRLLAFAAVDPDAKQGEGGHVHLLPASNVPRSDDLGAGGVSGAMHADADCPTCSVWLHENRFGPTEPLSEADQAKGIHSHSEDEIIFVIDGEMRLGNKLAGPGTALAIAADTLYSFTPGPKGLSFINFRAGKPGDIRFANGQSISETQYWRDRLPRPQYLEPIA